MDILLVRFNQSRLKSKAVIIAIYLTIYHLYLITMLKADVIEELYLKLLVVIINNSSEYSSIRSILILLIDFSLYMKQ